MPLTACCLPLVERDENLIKLKFGNLVAGLHMRMGISGWSMRFADEVPPSCYHPCFLLARCRKLPVLRFVYLLDQLLFTMWCGSNIRATEKRKWQATVGALFLVEQGSNSAFPQVWRLP